LGDVSRFLQLGRSCVLTISSVFIRAHTTPLIVILRIRAFTVLSSLIMSLLVIVEDLSFIFKVVFSLSSLTSSFGIILSKYEDNISWLYLVISWRVRNNVLDLPKVLLLVLTGYVGPL
jgi:hypothetical protein